tara:strand:- start:17596 stop:17718 length:123 start_codon:yes stop_codon:yes gene_type:complete
MPRIGDDLSLEPSLDEEDYINDEDYELEYDSMDYSNLVGR